MTTRRLPTLLVALLAATILAGIAGPPADAALPRARHYRPGARITLDTNLLSRSGTSAWAIDEYLRANTPLPALGTAFIAAEQKYGVNARFLLAAAMHESAWGTSSLSRAKHNLFGYNAYDRDPGRYASAFRAYAAGIDAVAKFMKEAYLTRGGRWWSGRPTLRAMQICWSSSGGWGVQVSRIASSLRLATLRRRSIRFAAPVVQGRLTGGARATVKVTWTGGAVPASIGFRATWVPVTLDAEVVGAATGATRAKPMTVKARRTSTGAHAITIALAAPRQPGRYRLNVVMLDVGGRPLPPTDRVAIPQSDVRVWGDRAVSVAVQPGAGGTGVAVRITNMGREAIPAMPGWASSGPGDAVVQAARTVVTVIATSGDPARPAPVQLLAAPLGHSLAPGASVAFDVPGIDAVTGRSTNWLSVDLHVRGNPTLLAAYLPVGLLRSGTELGPLTLPAPARADGVTAPTVRVDAAILGAPPEPGTPATPASSPAPASSPTATPKATPAAASKAAPAPTPRPTASPTPRPAGGVSRRPVTRIYQERSGAIRYRGRWGDAPYGGYAGGNVRWSATPGATATFTFSGSSVRWIGPLGPTRGRALVIVDGRAVGRVQLWNRSFVARGVLFTRTFKGAGRHTLTIRVLRSAGHPYVAVDGFVVRS